MMMFYIGASLLALLAIIFILWPLVMSRFFGMADTNHSSSHRESTNITLYKDHLADIEQSLAAGTVTESEYHQLKVELERNLLEDSHPNMVSETTMQASTKVLSGQWVLWCLVVLLPLGALAIYAQLGAYHAWQIKSIISERTELQRAFFASGGANEGVASNIEAQVTQKNHDLVAALTAYVDKKPDDLQMRTLLARTQIGFGRYSLGIKQFQAILSREPDASQIMAELAQALFLQAENRVVPRVQELVDQSLAIDADNTVALGLAGIAAFQTQQYSQAIDFWKKAVSLQGADSANGRALVNGISSAQALLAAQSGDVLQSGLAAQSSAKRVEQAAGEPLIRVAVSLSDKVKFSPDDTVFVYARAWRGAKLPLAITRIKASQLPITVDLTNAMSMAPSMNLSSASEVELVVRLSASGDPIAKPGDWQVTAGPITVLSGQQDVHNMVVSQVIKP